MEKTKKANLVVAGLLDYLKETNQNQLVPEVTRELEKLLEEGGKAQSIIITSAVPLTTSQSQELERILYKLLKVELPITAKVDKSILGGLTIKVGDWFLEATLLQQLNYLKRFMLS